MLEAHMIAEDLSNAPTDQRADRCRFWGQFIALRGPRRGAPRAVCAGVSGLIDSENTKGQVCADRGTPCGRNMPLIGKNLPRQT